MMMRLQVVVFLGLLLSFASAPSALATTHVNTCASLLLGGANWVKATRFEVASEAEIRDLVLNKISRTIENKQRPVVIVDLDATTYDIRYRNNVICRAWGESKESEPFPKLRALMKTLPIELTEHYEEQVLRNLVAIDPQAAGEFNLATESLKRFFKINLYSPESVLEHDRAYEHAAQYVRALSERGALIVYLSGRLKPTQELASQKRLEKDGFPTESGKALFIFKPSLDIKTVAFKQAASDQIRQLGILVAAFDNEPANLVAYREEFPDAILVFVDTLYSDRLTTPLTGLYRLQMLR